MIIEVGEEYDFGYVFYSWNSFYYFLDIGSNDYYKDTGWMPHRIKALKIAGLCKYLMHQHNCGVK